MSTPKKQEIVAAVKSLRGLVEYEGEINTILAALESAQKDSDRLDWLDRASSAEYSEGQCGWIINRREFGQTIRAAIDAALKSK